MRSSSDSTSVYSLPRLLLRRLAPAAVLVLMFMPFTGLFAQEVPSRSDEAPEPVEVLVFRPWNLEAGEPSAGDRGADPAPESQPGSATDAVELEQVLFQIAVNEVGQAGYRAREAAEWRVYEGSYGRDDALGLFPAVIAKNLGSDIALSLYFRREDQRVFLMAKAYDVRGSRIIAGNVEIARSGLTLVNDMNALMADILGQIEESREDIVLMRENPGTRVGTSPASVVFYAPDEGALLSMPGFGELGVISGGSFELPYQPLALGQQLELVRDKPHYYSRSDSFVITGPVNEISLEPMYPMTLFATELVYSLYSPLGAGMAFRWYLAPDLSFIRLQGRAAVIAPGSRALPGAADLIQSELLLEYGNYLFFGAQSRFRLWLASGAGMQISSRDASLNYIDSFLSLLGLSLEFNLPAVAFYLRQDLRYALPLFPNRIFGEGTDIWPEMIPLTLGVAFKW